MLKLLIVVVLAVGAFAQEIKLPEGQPEKLRDMLKQQCAKNGVDDNKITEIENVGKNFVECIKGIVNVEALKAEVEAAKPKGELDEVFKKYCAKSPELKGCIHALTSGVTPCLDAGMKEHVSLADNATDQLIDFVCHKDGDRIAMFIAEQGPECFQDKANEIRACAETAKASVSTLAEARALSLKDKCGKFDSLASCVTKALEGCANPTPANMAESLLRFVRNGSPCKQVPAA